MSTAVTVGRPEEEHEEEPQQEAQQVTAPPGQVTMLSNGGLGDQARRISVKKEGVKVGCRGSKFDRTVWDIKGKQFTKEERSGLCGGCCGKESWKYGELEFVEPSSWCVCFQSNHILRVKKDGRLVGVLSRPDSKDNPCCPEEVLILKVTDPENRQLFTLRQQAMCGDSLGPCSRVPPFVYCVQCCGWMPRISRDPGTCRSLWCTCLGCSGGSDGGDSSSGCCCCGGSGGGNGGGKDCCTACVKSNPCLGACVGCCFCVAAAPVGCAAMCCRNSSRERQPGCCEQISVPMEGGFWVTPQGQPWDKAVDLEGSLAQHMFWRSTEIEGLAATFRQETSEEEALAFTAVLMWELLNPSPTAVTATHLINQEMLQHEIKN